MLPHNTTLIAPGAADAISPRSHDHTKGAPLWRAEYGKLMTETTIAEDYLNGAEAIVEHLGTPWTIRRVRYARETGALPIRMKRGIGLYAFKSELLAALRGPDSLP